jgi:hypothetical protein
LDGWVGERWLDIRSTDVRALMQARLDLAEQKNCDAVEPDNDTGFNLTAADQLVFNLFLSQQAHARHLVIGLKNDLDQVAELASQYDFAVNEQCAEFAECDLLTPFITQHKPVLQVEYQQRYVDQPAARDALCVDSAKRHFSTLVLPLLLDDTFR